MFYSKKSIDGIVSTLRTEIENAAARSQELREWLPQMVKAAIVTDRNEQAAAQAKVIDDRQKSDTPFVEIISDGYDPELGVQLQLDWNVAFIKELKAKGYSGKNDRDVVNKWLITMHKQLPSQFEEQDKV